MWRLPPPGAPLPYKRHHCLTVLLTALLLCLYHIPGASADTETEQRERQNQKQRQKQQQHQALSTAADFKELSRYNATLPFEWRASAWTDCKYRDRSSCCDCYRHREVVCVHKEGEERVPPFYCRKLLPVPPHREEKCAPCRQPCVMAMWGAWSECSATCSPALRYRTRAVLLPASHGGRGCGDLLEVKPCDKGKVPCKVVDPRPEYSWHTLPWTSCRKPNNTRNCGQGLRTRQVLCLTKAGDNVSPLFCRHHLTDLEPVDTEPCDPACDCRVSHWSSWGPCSVTCRSAHRQGYQVRTRSVKHREKHGGLACPALRETRPCRDTGLPACPTFVWHLGDWEQCRVPGKPSDCGSGMRQRDVICVRQGDVTMTPVDDILCMQDTSPTGNSSALVRPAGEEPCKVACPAHCELGEWQNWSACTSSCGTGGTRVRQKPILMRATRGGAECGPRFENKPCEEVPCQWWHAGQWTRCFLPSFEPDACGAGTQVRNVYCLNALDEVLADERCSELVAPRPPTQRACRVPCPDDCQVSPWGAWGPCSTTCGATGGTQVRARTVISNGTSDAPCMGPDDLSQSRVCNQRPCRTYLWQASPWSPCVRQANATAPCGNGTGGQTRSVHCEMDPGYHVNNSLCERAHRPVQTRVCAAPCPEDCRLTPWAPWSACSHTCGSHSYKVRTRRVKHLAMYGGTACPPQADKNGVVVQKKRCKRVPECHTYHWEATPWTACLMEASCGHGVQRRNISCVRSDGTTIREDECYEKSPGAPPLGDQACFLPCDGDCELSPWSLWSPCSQTCGTGPGTKTKTRFILKLDSGLEPSAQCPHLRQSDMVETLPCGHVACPNFTWVSGDWGSCIVHKVGAQDDSLPCGPGVRRRHVLCERTDGVQVPHHHCDAVSMTPDRHEPCALPCQRDCRLGAWGAWGPCSQPCGDGVKTRVRVVLEEAEHGGRPCPHLEENTTCHSRDCSLFEWKVAPWSPCRPFYGIDCGRGQRKRGVTCRAGVEFEVECEKREARPPSTVNCDIPCLGDCEMTEWSDWSICSCRPNATRWRYRNVTKEPLPSAHQCRHLEEEEACYCPLYSVVTGEWTTCRLPDQGVRDTPRNRCGKGNQKRTANCVREDGVTVAMSYCRPEDTPTQQSCDLPCPIDCELTKFTPWSHCSAECGLEAYKERLRSVMTAANAGGRQCPDDHYLVQNTTCHTTACFTYRWRRLPWAPCSVQSPGCGVGSRTRLVECVRSDGMVVDEISCFTEEDRAESLTDLDPHERSERDLDTEQVCGEPCPGDCVVSSWSRYGPCFKDCASPGAVSIQVRTRVVLVPATGGRACPSHLMEVRPCRRDEVYCPTFYWRAGEWGPNASRKVSCMAHEHLEVSRGCPADLKPSGTRRCRGLCGQYARCVDGACTCMQGFTGDGYSCLPEYGCEDNSHCIVNATYCDVMNKECLCAGGLLPDEALQCPVLRVGEAGRGLFDSGLSTLVLYIIIGSVCALVILTLICTICLISRKKRKPPPHSNYPNLTKIDNLDTMQKNNELRERDVVVIHKFGTADKNLTSGGGGPYGTARYTPPTAKAYNQGPLTKDPSKNSLDTKICLLDPDDDLFGNNSDSSTKPLVDDPDYVPMYGANGADTGSTSTNSISPDLPSFGHLGLSSLPPSPAPRALYGRPDDPRAPPLPPPNHRAYNSSSSSPTTPTMPRNDPRRGALPRSATYETAPGSSRTLPRSMRGGPEGGGSPSPWLQHPQQQPPQPRSQSQQTLPRPAKRVWFPQAGDKKPRSTDRLPSSPHLDDRHPATLPPTEDTTQRNPRPPLKPKPSHPRVPPAPLTLPSAEEPLGPSTAGPGGASTEDIKYSGDPPRTPNGLVYPAAPPKLEDQQGAGAAGTRLMEYCDELLQELETMAKG